MKTPPFPWVALWWDMGGSYEAQTRVARRPQHTAARETQIHPHRRNKEDENEEEDSWRKRGPYRKSGEEADESHTAASK